MNRLSTLAASLLLAMAAAVTHADSLPINEQPMYGEQEKSKAMKSADAAFIAGIEAQGTSRAEGARQSVQAGWTYWRRKDLGTAMQRFNQAWLLDPENGDAYHGFALITAVREGSPTTVERLFRVATSKPNVGAEAYVDYGRFLWTQKRLDASLEQLGKALGVSKTALNARSNAAFVHYLKGDFGSACRWGRDALTNGETLERGFLEEMCSRAGKT